MLFKNRGFTLVELMIVVAIIGILASVAYPSYQDHIRKARRTDCQGMLAGLANAMERHYTSGFTYMDAGTTDLGTDANSTGDHGAPTIYAAQCPNDGTTKYYNLTIKNDVTQSNFTLVATPIGGQDGDGAMELTSTGIRRWDKDDNDTFAASENTWEE